MKKNLIVLVLIGIVCLMGCSVKKNYVSKEGGTSSVNIEKKTIDDTFIKKTISFYALVNNDYIAKIIEQNGKISDDKVTGDDINKMKFAENTDYQYLYIGKGNEEDPEQRIEVNKIDNKLYLATYDGNKVNECKSKNSVEFKSEDFSFLSKKEVEEEIVDVLDYLEVKVIEKLDIQPIVAGKIECYNISATLENGFSMEILYSENGMESIAVQ